MIRISETATAWWKAAAACALVTFALVLVACGSSKQPVASAGTGSRLVLARAQSLVIRDATGTEKAIATTPPSAFPNFPVWAPDQARIAYVQTVPFTGQTNADWGGDVYLIDPSGGTPQLVWKHDQIGADVQGLAWTPDGKALLLGYALTKYLNGAYGGQEYRLQRLDLASGQLTPLVEGGVYPSVSRDGSRMAYETFDPVTGGGGISVAALDGSGARQVLAVDERFPSVFGPRISPDGTTIAFSTSATSSAPTPTSGSSGPSLNPLERLAGFLLPHTAAAHGLPQDIWRITIADGSVLQLTHFKEDDPYPSWSRDGKTVFVFATGGLYDVNADGSGVKKVGRGEFSGRVDANWFVPG